MTHKMLFSDQSRGVAALTRASGSKYGYFPSPESLPSPCFSQHDVEPDTGFPPQYPYFTLPHEGLVCKIYVKQIVN